MAAMAIGMIRRAKISMADLNVKPLKDVTITGSYVHAFHVRRMENFGMATMPTGLSGKSSTRGRTSIVWAVMDSMRNMGNLGAFADLGHDDEWSTREPTFINGVRGWYFGFKCVPAIMWNGKPSGHRIFPRRSPGVNPVKRHILRTWLDFHF